MMKMISNRSIWIAAMVFFLAPGLLGLGGKPDSPEPKAPASKSVKIERPAKTASPDPGAAPSGEDQKSRPQSDSASAGQPETSQEKDDSLQVQDQTGDTGKSAEQALEELMISEQDALFGDQERLYTRQGRVDPFEPFLRKPEPETTSEEGAEIQRRTPQTPLERIALSQLKLTAILRLSSKKDPIAMVEDPTGKGYVVREGMWIGDQGGRIADILSDRIIVEEQYKDVFGKVAVREIEKKLQK